MNAVQLPTVIDDPATATRWLVSYYTSGLYTGGYWDAFDPSGTRGFAANVFTADDIASAALLNTPIRNRAVATLLVTERARFAHLLEAIGPDRDFIDVDPDPVGPDMKPVYRLLEELDALDGIGKTRASKLIARKRPRLMPILDSAITKTVFSQVPKSEYYRTALHEALSADDRTVWKRLAQHREAADLPHDVSLLRVFDVLAWMEATRGLSSPRG